MNNNINTLRLKENLRIIEERKNAALRASLVCSCKNEFFKIYYYGKKTKGILSSHLRKSKGQIVIEAICSSCNNKYVVFDSKIDGRYPKDSNEVSTQELIIKDNSNYYQIIISYNYWNKYYLSNLYDECFIYLIDDNGKEYVLYE